MSANAPMAGLPSRNDTTSMVLSASQVRNVIFASSLGTVFEWYDFYLYGSPA